jgi:protein ImuB
VPARRILSVWFPRLAAERWLRRAPELAAAPFAVVAAENGALRLSSLGPVAEAAGLRRGTGLADARAILPGLVTRPADPVREADFLAALARWAGRFSPWMAVEGEEGLVLDVTGCAHLFGGEAGLAAAVAEGAGAHGLTLRAGLADTVGTAWAVARYDGQAEARDAPGDSLGDAPGDAIDQEARATRSRAARRPARTGGAVAPGVVVVPPGGARAALAALPVAALRLEPEAVAALAALGLRRVEDVAVLPRAQLARRIGVAMVRRLDQALGREPEPVAAARPRPGFALRLTCPEPLGLEADVVAGIGRLAEALGARLRAAGMGVRRLRAVLERTGGAAPAVVEAGFARPVDRGEAMMAVLGLRLVGLEAGFGFDVLRLKAVVVEPRTVALTRGAPGRDGPEGIADLIGRLGGRIGIDALVRLHPADSHIPEKAATEAAAGFAPAAGPWPVRDGPRPLSLFPPEPVEPKDRGRPPLAFRWRRRRHRRAAAFGPERIAPEWWLDDPAWRSGPRDYWRVETEEGLRLWLYEAQGGEMPGGWFVQGGFG